MKIHPAFWLATAFLGGATAQVCDASTYPLEVVGDDVSGIGNVIVSDKESDIGTLVVNVEIVGDLRPGVLDDHSTPTLISKVHADARCDDSFPDRLLFDEIGTYEPGETNVAFDIAQPDCGSGPVYGAVCTTLQKKGGIDALNDLFPVDVEFKVIADDRGSGTSASYFDMKFLPGTLLHSLLDNLEVNGNCVDVDQSISTNTWYTATAYSYLEGDFSGTMIDKPQHLDSVAWLINNYKPGVEYTEDKDGDGNNEAPYLMTSGTIQRAIWYIIDNLNYPDPGGAYEEPWALFISGKALLEGDGFVPDCLDFFPVVLVPDGTAQRQIIQTTFAALQIPCTTTDATACGTFEYAPCTVPPTSPGVNGDPHIFTWGGQMFDFHGECDLVLLSSPHFDHRKGFDVHVRTKIEPGTFWSYIESAVVRIGDDTLEMQGGSDATWFWINGEPNKLQLDINKPFLTTMGGYSVRIMQKGEKQRKIVIKRDKEEVVVIKSYDEIVRVDVRHGLMRDFKGSLGLIGTFPEGKKVARDGATVMDDDVEFGKHWQVMESEPKLFHNVEGVQAPQACTMPTQTTTQRRLGESLSRKKAEKACANVYNKQWNIACVTDVLATGDTGVAGAYENDAASAF